MAAVVGENRQGRAVALTALPSPRLRFDFPPLDGRTGPLIFATPREILVAREADEVRAVLARADRLARGGAWVAGFVCYEAGAAFDPAFRFRGCGPLPLCA